ncbi:MAG: SDR family NAD(P)-dependent oxidoreductase [Candidatus Binataceae bacterium]
MTRVLVLGASSPIARALALKFAHHGAELYLAARDGVEASRIAEDIAVRAGAKVHHGEFDATAFASHRGFVDGAFRALGGLDTVVVAFGTLGDQQSAQVDPSAALATIDQNYGGAVSLLTEAANILEARRSGFVIVFGSVAGDRGRARNYVSGSAKAALAVFAQGLRARLARAGVRVLTVKLGTVDTRMTWGREGVRFTISPEAAAAAIFAAWRSKREVVYVPRRWRPIMFAIKMIPERWFKRVKF